MFLKLSRLSLSQKNSHTLNLKLIIKKKVHEFYSFIIIPTHTHTQTQKKKSNLQILHITLCNFFFNISKIEMVS